MYFIVNLVNQELAFSACKVTSIWEKLAAFSQKLPEKRKRIVKLIDKVEVFYKKELNLRGFSFGILYETIQTLCE